MNHNTGIDITKLLEIKLILLKVSGQIRKHVPCLVNPRKLNKVNKGRISDFALMRCNIEETQGININKRKLSI